MKNRINAAPEFKGLRRQSQQTRDTEPMLVHPLRRWTNINPRSAEKSSNLQLPTAWKYYCKNLHDVFFGWLLFQTIKMTTQWTKNICLTFIQHRPNVFDVGPTLYKCYTDVLCLLGTECLTPYFSMISSSYYYYLLLFILFLGIKGSYLSLYQLPDTTL